MKDLTPINEKFDPQFAIGTPLYEAVAQLADLREESIEAMNHRDMKEIFDLAVETYGENLPEFWQNWRSWNDG